ncbi:hypothetical protein B0H13DRAFT_1865149 [Mycena leptocephala]|nr:hypothetical protein B0H13DRAFT_1865149 [Mycena leptocephala]
MSKNEASYTLRAGLEDPVKVYEGVESARDFEMMKRVVKLQPQLVDKMNKMRRTLKYIEEVPGANTKGRCPVARQNNTVEQATGFEIPVKPAESLDTILYKLLDREDGGLGAILNQAVGGEQRQLHHCSTRWQGAAG